jgi:hypothetical protein
MIFRKKIYLILVFLLIIFTSVMLGFIKLNHSKEEYKGTLVKENSQEVIISNTTTGLFTFLE